MDRVDNNLPRSQQQQPPHGTRGNYPKSIPPHSITHYTIQCLPQIPISNRSGKLSTIRNHNFLNRPVQFTDPRAFDQIKDLMTLDHAAEYHVFPIEVRGWAEGEEELTAVGVGTGVLD